jgi:hypothetical protein
MTDEEINALKLDDAVRVRDTAQRAIDMLTSVRLPVVERGQCETRYIRNNRA